MKRTNHTKRSTNTVALSWTVLVCKDQLQFSYVELHSSKAEEVSWLVVGDSYRTREFKEVTVIAKQKFSTLAGAKTAMLLHCEEAITNNAMLRIEYGME